MIIGVKKNGIVKNGFIMIGNLNKNGLLMLNNVGINLILLIVLNCMDLVVNNVKIISLIVILELVKLMKLL